LRRALISAAKNGVEVKLVLPGIKTDNSMSRYIGHGYYAKLLQSKVRIFEYQAHFIHSKVVMVDDWVTIGSSNLDRWGANWNLEANQEIQDKDFALSIKQMFVNDFNNCNEITLAMWKQRSWQQKLKVWLWKYLGKIIAKIGLNNDE
jgi:phosphatidylserine/phosphatidylglycerophosphate/cardiolipin synthase-like enzyme